MKLSPLIFIAFLVPCAAWAEGDSATLTGSPLSQDTIKLISILNENTPAVDALLKDYGKDPISFSRGAVKLSAHDGEPTMTYQLEAKKCEFSSQNYKCLAAGTLTIEEFTTRSDDWPGTKSTYVFSLNRHPISGTPMTIETLELASIFVDHRAEIYSLAGPAENDRHSFSGGTVTTSATPPTKTYDFAGANCAYSPDNGRCVWFGTLTIKREGTGPHKTFTISFKISGLG